MNNLNANSEQKNVPLSELLKESDFISIHVPLMKATYHLIGEKELKMMKKTAILSTLLVDQSSMKTHL